MKKYSYKVILIDNKGEVKTEINTDFHARDDAEAEILVRRQYPPAKGYIYEKM